MKPKSKIQVQILTLIIFFMCSISACTNMNSDKTEETLSTLTPSPTFTHTSTKTLTVSPTKTLLPIITSTPKLSITAIPTVTPFIVEPTATLTITSVPPITNRQPSISELDSYLTELSLEEAPFEHIIEVIYEDVNGDGEIDLVVSDYLFVGIFIWQDDQYTGSFIYQGYPWKYDPGSQITLEDWTNDGIPEVIFDFRDDTGGTGVRVTNWTRYVIHCQQNESTCKVIWAGQLGAFYEGYGPGGVALLQTDVDQINDVNESPSLEIVTESFAIYSQGTIPYSSQIGDGILSYNGGRKTEGFPPYYPRESLKVYTSTLDIFTWNGSEFEWQETQVLKPAKYTESLAVLEAINGEGKTASISVKPNNDAGLENDICQLDIDGITTGLQFGCKDNFTVVEWRDVTNDNTEELVIMAYSGVYTNVGFDGEGNFPDKDCIHQRVIVYQQVNSLVKEIANVTGCVVQSDLYGVRFEDIDDDGQLEILAASGWFTSPRCSSVFSAKSPDGQQENCWYEFGYQNEIYRWNGSKFIFWGIKE